MCNKVRSYEGVLSKETIEENLKFHMIPGYKPTRNDPMKDKDPFYPSMWVLHIINLILFYANIIKL